MLCTQMEFGGVQIRALEIQKYIKRHGGHADVVFLYKKRDIFPGEKDLICLINGKPKSPFEVLKALFKLYRIVKGGKYDSIVGFAHYSSPIATFIGLISGVKSRIATQTNPPHRSKFGAVPLDKICGLLGVYTSNIAASSTIAENLLSYPKPYVKRIKVIHNGIRAMHPSKDRSEWRDKLKVAEGDVLLLNCGRLSPQKNQSFIINLMTRLPNNYKLAIVGEGELETDLNNQIRTLGLGTRVHLVGGLKTEQMADFLAAGDIFLFPSRFEAFGLAMVEAMAVGVPVISSDYPALVEVGGDAIIPLPVTEESLWTTTIMKLGDSTMREDMIKRGSDRARSMSSDAMSEKFVKEMFA